jgi:hypothetical protein
MNEIDAFLVFTIPLLIFVSVGILEFRGDQGTLRSRSRILPLALAVILSVALLVDVFHPYLSLALSLSRPMSVLALLVAVSAFFFRYKSRLSAALMFIGALVLAFFWLLNRWVAQPVLLSIRCRELTHDPFFALRGFPPALRSALGRMRPFPHPQASS